MTDIASHPPDARVASRPAFPNSLLASPPDTDDPARQIGEIFRRLALASDTFPSQAFGRISVAVLVAIGKAVLEEAEAQARRLRERTAPPRSGIGIPPTARRVDFDGWDAGDPSES